MMSWTIASLDTALRRDMAGGLRHFNPSTGVKMFVDQCKANGMSKQETTEAAEERFRYFPTEAEIIVNDFWNSAPTSPAA